MSKESVRSHWKRHHPRDPHIRIKLSHVICSFIMESQEFLHAKHVGIFHPLPWEVDLLEVWHHSPARCAFPKIAGQSLLFYTIESPSQLTSGLGRLKEPIDDPSRLIRVWEKSDLFLVPGFGFDAFGARVGSGRGFYDRFLATVPGIRWGVAFCEQVHTKPLVQELNDVRMDAVVTENGVLQICGGL